MLENLSHLCLTSIGTKEAADGVLQAIGRATHLKALEIGTIGMGPLLMLSELQHNCSGELEHLTLSIECQSPKVVDRLNESIHWLGKLRSLQVSHRYGKDTFSWLLSVGNKGRLEYLCLAQHGKAVPMGVLAEVVSKCKVCSVISRGSRIATNKHLLGSPCSPTPAVHLLSRRLHPSGRGRSRRRQSFLSHTAVHRGLQRVGYDRISIGHLSKCFIQRAHSAADCQSGSKSAIRQPGGREERCTHSAEITSL